MGATLKSVGSLGKSWCVQSSLSPKATRSCKEVARPVMRTSRLVFVLLTVASVGCASSQTALQQKCSAGDQAACNEVARAAQQSQVSVSPSRSETQRDLSMPTPNIAPMVQMP